MLTNEIAKRFSFSINLLFIKILQSKLKELRLESNLTQTELAKETGLSQTGIGKWEANQRTPSIDVIIILCNYFKVSAGYLIGLED